MHEQQLGITLSIIGHNSRDSGTSVLTDKTVKRCLEWDSSLPFAYLTLNITQWLNVHTTRDSRLNEDECCLSPR